MHSHCHGARASTICTPPQPHTTRNTHTLQAHPTTLSWSSRVPAAACTILAGSPLRPPHRAPPHPTATGCSPTAAHACAPPASATGLTYCPGAATCSMACCRWGLHLRCRFALMCAPVAVWAGCGLHVCGEGPVAVCFMRSGSFPSHSHACVGAACTSSTQARAL